MTFVINQLTFLTEHY